MKEAVLRALLNAIAAWVRVALANLLGPVRMGVHMEPSQLAALLVGAVRSGRRAAWASQVLFLESQLGDLDADAVWVPPIPGYAEAAIERAVREVPGVLESEQGVDSLIVALERHVLAAARQTAEAAVEDAPGGVETAEPVARTSLTRDLAQLLDGDETARALAEREEARRRRNADAIERALADVARRVDEAMREVRAHEATRGMSEVEQLIAAVPVSARTDVQGRRILRPFAWARVTRPGVNGPCGFCQLLAARGPVYESARTAGIRATAFHDNCRCTAVPVFTSREWEGKAEAEAYAKVYAQVVIDHGLTGVDARRAMDRYARERRRRNAQ